MFCEIKNRKLPCFPPAFGEKHGSLFLDRFGFSEIPRQVTLRSLTPFSFIASRGFKRLYATSLSHALTTSSCSAGKNVSPISALFRIERYMS